MEVDSTWTQFFWVSRNNVVAQASRKVWSRASPGITPAVLWNCVSRNQNWVVCLWDAALVYLQDRRQKKSPIWIKLTVHWAFGEELVFPPILITSPREVAFFPFGWWVNIGVVPCHS